MHPGSRRKKLSAISGALAEPIVLYREDESQAESFNFESFLTYAKHRKNSITINLS